VIVLTGKTARGKNAERETKMGRRAEALGYGEMIARPFRPPAHRLPWALDNGAWGAFSHGKPWDPAPFLEDYEAALRAPVAPMFVVCPDIVAGGGWSRSGSRWSGRRASLVCRSTSRYRTACRKPT
jgi:hypothetical protein